MTRRTLDRSQAARTYDGPPADRMAGRPGGTRAARAAGNLTPKPAVSAATVARANAFLGREALLDHAVHAGVIGTNMRGHYAACFDADPEGTRAYLGGIGLARQEAAEASDAYDETTLSPVERQRIEAARQGGRPRLGGEGP
jgi:hypothetical protein